MAEPLERQIVLDISPALGAIQDLDSAFEQLASSITANISAAIAAGIEGTGAEAVDLEANVDTAEVDAELAALSDEPIDLAADLDAADAEATIAELDANPVELEADLDVSGPEADIEELSGTTVELTAELDTAGAQEELGGLGDAGGEAAGGLGAADVALGGLLAKAGQGGGPLGQITGVATKLGPAGIAAGVGAGALTAGLVKLVDAGTETLAVVQQFDSTFGSFAGQVQDIDIGGLSTQLDELAISLGADDEAVLAATSRAGALAQQLGLTQEEAARFAEQVAVVGASVQSSNPALGDLDAVIGKIAQTVAKNPKGLAKLGIEITPEEIAAAAAELGKVPEELSKAELAAISAEIALGKVGDTSDEIGKRQQNAGVILQSFQTRISELFEEIAVPVAIPVIQALEDFAPVIQSLTPAARVFGEAFGTVIRLGVEQLSRFTELFGQIVAGIGDVLQAADGIPFVGDNIANVGDELETFGVGLEEASQAARDTGSATDTAEAGIEDVGSAAARGTGPLIGFAEGEGAAAGGAEELTAAIGALVTSAVSALPNAAGALNEFNSGVSSAFSNLGSVQEAAAAANTAAGEAVAEARTQLAEAQAAAAAAGPEQAEAAAARIAEATTTLDEALGTVVTTQAEGTVEIAAAQEQLNRAVDPQVLIDRLRTQALEIAAFQTNLKTLLELGLTDLVAFLAEQGPAVGGQLAASLVNDQALAQQTEAGLDGLESATGEFERFMTEEAAPRIEGAVNAAFRFDKITVRTEGQTIGEQFAAGLAAGLTSAEARKAVENSSRLAVRRAKEAAMSEAGARSPSLVFAAIGEDLVAGLALGMRETAAVEEAAVGLARAAVPTLELAQAASPPIPTLVGVGAPTAGTPAAGGVLVQGPLIGEVNENADPAHISAELAWRLGSL